MVMTFKDYLKNTTLGTQPIHELRAPQVIDVLKPMEARGNPETVKRLNDVMTFAVNTGLIAANPLSGIKASFKRPKKKTYLRYPLTNYPSLQSFWHW